MRNKISFLPQAVDFFNEHGFLGPFKVYEQEEAREILKAVRLKNLDRSKAIYDNDVNYDRHFDISELSRHICHPVIVERLKALIGSDILCWRSEFFSKFPGSKGTEWHQVETYKYSTGKAQLVPTVRLENIPMELTVWTTFTESTKENGCLKFLPGSHKTLYYDESVAAQTGRNQIYDMIKTETGFYGYNFEEYKVDPNWQPDESKAVAMEMEPGEAVIFTARCVHGSFSNTSKRSTRFALSSRYVPTSVRVYPDQTEFIEHGGLFDLTNHGSILVSGVDTYKHNRLRYKNNLGEPFPVKRKTSLSQVVQKLFNI
jgi:non-heme Fe2+,alpha-ketoglutarate-dependent halogenase